MSLSDGVPTMTMPVAPANSNSGGFGWGGEGSWFIILFLIFAVFGWGGNGWGGSGNGSNGSGAVDGYVLTSDFANIERKLDSVNLVCYNVFAQCYSTHHKAIIARAVNFCNCKISSDRRDNMPEKWTGELVGRMHNECITNEALAKELGVTKPYISMLLNSKRKPDGVQTRLEAAVDAIIQRRKAQ